MILKFTYQQEVLLPLLRELLVFMATSKNSTLYEILAYDKRTFASVDFVDVAIARKS